MLGEPRPEKTTGPAQLGPRHRSLEGHDMLAQGEVLEGELMVAAAEECEQSQQLEQEVIIGRRFSSTPVREINHFGGGRGFGEGQLASGAQDPRTCCALRSQPIGGKRPIGGRSCYRTAP